MKWNLIGKTKTTAGLIKCAALTNPASSHSDDVAY